MKIVAENTGIFDIVDGQKYYLTDFICNETADIPTEGEMLNYPAGSSILCLEDGKCYVLDEEKSAYTVPGEYTPADDSEETPDEPADDPVEDDNNGGE